MGMHHSQSSMPLADQCIDKCSSRCQIPACAKMPSRSCVQLFADFGVQLHGDFGKQQFAGFVHQLLSGFVTSAVKCDCVGCVRTVAMLARHFKAPEVVSCRPSWRADSARCAHCSTLLQCRQGAEALVAIVLKSRYAGRRKSLLGGQRLGSVRVNAEA